MSEAAEEPVAPDVSPDDRMGHGTSAADWRRWASEHLLGGRPAEAAGCFERALALDPNSARAHGGLGQALWQQGRIEPARVSFGRALALDSRYVPALVNLGNLEFLQGAYEAALGHYEAAMAAAPTLALPALNAANALMKLGAADRALVCYRDALARGAGAEGYFGCGNALRAMGQSAEALSSYDAALAARAAYPEALINSAVTLLDLRRPRAALERCERALAYQPDSADAHCNRGVALHLLARTTEALAALRAALNLVPDHADAQSNLVVVCAQLRRFDEAEQVFGQLQAQGRASAAVWEHYAAMLLERRQMPEAIAAYEHALTLDPARPFVRGALLGARLAACDWHTLGVERGELEGQLRAGTAVCTPFTLLGFCDDPALQRRCAEVYASVVIPAPPADAWRPVASTHRRLRIAYLSGDFHQHATALLMAGVFERHDRTAFEVIGVSYGPEDGSLTRARVKQAFDEFLDVSGTDDESVIDALRARQIDIAVDLKGYTAGMRPAIIARRVAPVQVSWLGFPGTQGSLALDYLFADAIVVPAGEHRHYVEQVVTLPHSYYPTDDRLTVGATTLTRAQAGLPDGVVYCCFNNAYKIQPATFDAWMRILAGVDGSVLWLLADNDAAVSALMAAATERGIDPRRLVFAPRVATTAHLARQRLADLFLDTLPYNAHTTATDALWVGLPVLTCRGRSWVGRVGASVLGAVGMSEMVTENLHEYESRAIALGRSAEQREALRGRLRARLGQCALFDTQRLTRHVEYAYRHMRERQRAGLPPAAFEVPSDCHLTVTA